MSKCQHAKEMSDLKSMVEALRSEMIIHRLEVREYHNMVLRILSQDGESISCETHGKKA